MLSNLMQNYFINEPDVLNRVSQMDRSNIQKWAAENASTKQIHLIGSGSSYHMAKAAKNLFDRFVSADTIVSIPTEVTSDSLPDLHETIVLISHEGKSVNTHNVALKLKEQQIPFAVLTAVLDSPTAKLAGHVIHMPCGIESCGPKTIGVLSTYVTLSFMAIELGYASKRITAEDRKMALRQLEENIESLATNIDECRKNYALLADRLKPCSSVLFISDHAAKPFSDEAALKIIETLYVPCCTYEVEEFVHGPHCLIGTAILFIGLLDGGSEDERIRELCKFASEKGNPTFIVSTLKEKSDRECSNFELLLKGHTDFPFHLLLPFQMISAFMAEELGHDLDRPKFSGFATRFGSKLI